MCKRNDSFCFLLLSKRANEWTVLDVAPNRFQCCPRWRGQTYATNRKNVGWKKQNKAQINYYMSCILCVGWLFVFARYSQCKSNVSIDFDGNCQRITNGRASRSLLPRPVVSFVPSFAILLFMHTNFIVVGFLFHSHLVSFWCDLIVMWPISLRCVAFIHQKTNYSKVKHKKKCVHKFCYARSGVAGQHFSVSFRNMGSRVTVTISLFIHTNIYSIVQVQLSSMAQIENGEFFMYITSARARPHHCHASNHITFAAKHVCITSCLTISSHFRCNCARLQFYFFVFCSHSA